jgi:hypothetical protein
VKSGKRKAKTENKTASSHPVPHSAFRIPHSNGGLPRIRTVFSPGKSRDFTVKVCSPTRHEGGSRHCGTPQAGL